MIEEYKGIYFRNKNSKIPQKRFYEHGAHFEYKALYKILEEISKKIKPRINSSIPKRKNTSLNRKRASSCRKKEIKTKLQNKNEKNINIQRIIKFNLSMLKLKNKKNTLNRSLIIKEKKVKNFSCEKNNKNINNMSFNTILENKNSESKKYTKYNSSYINNSMENLYNDNKFLSESYNINYKDKKISSNIYKINKKNLKFNAIALTDFSKKNDNIIFSFNENIKTDSSRFINKYYTEKNNNLITKENKNESIGEIIPPFSLKEEPKKENTKIKNKLNISNIKLNNIKSGTSNNYICKKDLNFEYDKIITLINKYQKNSKNIEENIKFRKSSVNKNINKYSNKENLKLYKYQKNQGNNKKKISRNKENLKTVISFFNNNNKNNLTLNNIKNYNTIIKNETEKKYLNISTSDLIKEKKDDKMKNKKEIKNCAPKIDMKKYFKNYFLEKNKLKLEIKENPNYSKTSKNEEQKKITTEKNKYNYCYNKKVDNNLFTGSTKSNNDSINISKSNKNGDKKSIINTNFTSHINSNGILIPFHRKKNDI